MPQLSPNALAAAFASETDYAYLVLLEINHPEMPEPIRVVRNFSDITSNGHTYFAYPFEFVFPDARPDQPPQASISIDNVDTVITKTLRQLSSAPTVTMSVVTDKAPDTVELGPLTVQMKTVTWNSLVVSASLGYQKALQDMYPKDIVRPGTAPGSFASS